jgi:hypothetical protein
MIIASPHFYRAASKLSAASFLRSLVTVLVETKG